MAERLAASLVMVGDQPIEEPDAPSGAPASVDFGLRRTHAGAGDIEMRPRRLVDEALEKLRRGDRPGATPAGILHVGKFRIDELVVFGSERHAPHPFGRVLAGL